jgi:hypothetical protein
LRIEGAFGSSRFSGGVLRTPIPGQEFVNAPGRVIGQASEHVGEPGLRVDIVELGGGDQRVDRSSAPAAFVGAGEGSVLSPQGNGPQLAFGGVVRHAKTPILEEAGEGVPPVEAVVDRFGRVAVLGEPGTLFAQLSRSCVMTLFAVSARISKAMPTEAPDGEKIAALTPMTLPSMSKLGPPELPLFTGASIWIKSSYGPAPMSRPSAETIPAVAVSPSPNGLPTASTQSPIRGVMSVSFT